MKIFYILSILLQLNINKSLIINRPNPSKCIELRAKINNAIQPSVKLHQLLSFPISVLLTNLIAQYSLATNNIDFHLNTNNLFTLLVTAEVDQSIPTSIKLPSGVEYVDAVVGTGDEIVKEGSSVQFQWVLRRSNGYFVDASSNYGQEPFIYKVGNTKKVIRGIDEAIRGMKVGGIRRITIPSNLAFVEGVGDGKPGPMPAGFGPRRQILTRIDTETWYFEIKLTKLKN
jgi:hypothetical protein